MYKYFFLGLSLLVLMPNVQAQLLQKQQQLEMASNQSNEMGVNDSEEDQSADDASFQEDVDAAREVEANTALLEGDDSTNIDKD